MADIDVVPKKRTNTWMWIILAIVVALLLLWALGMFSAEMPQTVSELTGSWVAERGVAAT